MAETPTTPQKDTKFTGKGFAAMQGIENPDEKTLTTLNAIASAKNEAEARATAARPTTTADNPPESTRSDAPAMG